MSKSEIPPVGALYPVPVVLVTCLDARAEKSNIITIAWCGVVCSKPPLLSIAMRPATHSHRLIKETGDFVINIPSKDLLEKVDICGTLSGRDTDKFRLTSFTKAPSSKVKSPLIKECPVNIECLLKTVTSLGSHDMFIGEAVLAHADDAILGSDGKIDFTKAGPFVYNQGEYWDLGKKIGYYGCSSK